MTEERREAEIRASDMEREHVVERLREASAEARLTLAELIDRSDAAYNARTRGELEELTRDLPAPAAPDAVAGSVERTTVRRRASRWLVAVMSGADRRGRWRPAERLNAVAIMGGSDIDLRGAEVSGSQVTITAVAVMGGIDITVPEGVEVDFTGFAFMGGRDEKVADVPRRPGTPLVRVRGFALMGGITVKSKPSKNPAANPFQG